MKTTSQFAVFWSLHSVCCCPQPTACQDLTPRLQSWSRLHLCDFTLSACLSSQLRSLGSHKMSGYKNPHFSSSWSPDPQVSQGQMAGRGGSCRLQLLLPAARLTSQTLIHLISELKPQVIFLVKAERTPLLPKASLGERKKSLTMHFCSLLN